MKLGGVMVFYVQKYDSCGEITTFQTFSMAREIFDGKQIYAYLQNELKYSTQFYRIIRVASNTQEYHILLANS